MSALLLTLRRRSGSIAQLKALAAGGALYDGITSLPSSGAITTWPALVGLDVTQATAGKRPIAGTLNGKPAAVFDGVDDSLQSVAFGAALAQPTTIISISKRTADVTGSSFGIFDGILTTNRNCAFHSGDSFVHLISGTNMAGVLQDSQIPICVRAVFNGASSRAYVNGTAQGAALANAGTQTLTGFTIGNIFTGGSATFPGPIAAAMIIPNAADGDARAIEAERRLMARYGIRPVQTVFEGDSRTAAGWPTTALPIAAFAAQQPIGYPTATVAGSGDTVATMITQGPSAVDAIRDTSTYKQIAVIWGGLNDDANGLGATYDVIHTRLQTWCLARRAAGFKVIVCTEIDCASVDGLVRWHTSYLNLNTLIRANWTSYADGLADLGADARLQDATNTTYFNADKTHLVAAGYAVVAGIVAPVLATVGV